MKLQFHGVLFASSSFLTYINDSHMHREVFGKAIVEHADKDGAIRLVPPWSEMSMADGGLAVKEELGKLLMAWDEWGGVG